MTRDGLLQARLAQRLGILCLLGITAIWGTTFLVLWEVQRDWLPWPLMAVRFGLAAAVLLPLGPLRGLSRAVWRHALGLGGLAFIGFALQTVSLRFTSEAHCAFGTSLITVFVPLLEAAVSRRPVARSTLLAMLCATVGMLLLLSPQAAAGSQPAPLLGDGLAVLGALAFGAQIVWLSRSARRLPLLPLVWAELVVVAGCSALCMQLRQQPLPPFAWQSYAQVAYLGVIASALCFFGQLWGQARVGAVQAAFIYALEPLFATALAWQIHGQALHLGELWGSLAIFASALVAEGPAAARLNRRRPRR